MKKEKKETGAERENDTFRLCYVRHSKKVKGNL